MEEKYATHELSKIEVLDLVSRYGEEASLSKTRECLTTLCGKEVQEMFGGGPLL